MGYELPWGAQAPEPDGIGLEQIRLGQSNPEEVDSSEAVAYEVVPEALAESSDLAAETSDSANSGSPLEAEAAETALIPEPGRLERLWNGMRRNKTATAVGALTVASLVATPLATPFGQTVKSLAETTKYVGPGMVAAEMAWIGGAAMMLAAIGKKVLNPLKIRSHFREIPEAAAESNLFMAGLVVNTTAALAEFAIPTLAVTTKLPVESWGVLAVSTFDLIATVALRRLIWRGIHQNRKA